MNDQTVKDLDTEIQAHHEAREGKPIGFGEYLERFLANPAAQSRGAAHYIRDTFDHFGVDKIATPAGMRKRFRMFDATFRGNESAVSGQEETQEDIYRLLNNFIRSRRVDRLILLHGPNGSAKTSIVRAIVHGMEHYAATDEGALYRFRWVFPAEKVERGSIGFGEDHDGPASALATYAHLPGDSIDAVLECDLKDHPLLLVPIERRQALFDNLRATGQLDPDYPIPDYLWRGDLCHQCREVHDALLAAYGGDSREVLRHIQVVRLKVSGRYRQAVATVEPQMHVDAAEQQLTASHSLASLPRAISHMNLFQPRGPIVDANRGLLEYNDLLKRHIDTFKYLLVTCESGQVTLDRSTLYLDTVFIGSTNDMLLDSFKEYADFASFKGRLELVRVPYLRRVEEEERIYTAQIPEKVLGRHMAPHTMHLAALWAVLTRLRRPQAPPGASRELREAIESLGPLEKAELYNRGDVPARVRAATARELLNSVEFLYQSPAGDYEGRTGASAREVRMLLMNAAQREDRTCLSPLGLFEEIRELLEDKSVFAFLQLKPEGDYRDQDKLRALLDTAYLDALEESAARAMGLVTDASYRELFHRYIQHVSHWLRKERLVDPVTNDLVPPSEDLMKEVETILRAGDEDPASFRKNLISRVGAYSLETAKSSATVQGPLDYERVFPTLFERLKDDFVTKRRVLIKRALRLFLEHGDSTPFNAKDARLNQEMREALSRLGFCESCAQEAMAYLLKQRFEG